ncbi:unnamed protein product [Allacma fusca]|uniref:Down syndrome cell adhesion molecule-like protein Dscam2 n=1 Tax=Allacma fusca TaxID=39272 RepID=A0A8J2NQJ9_9HEXA|nr:unnamed protein product [Allacma fusca]
MELPGPTLLERYPDPVVVHEGEPVILHCVGGYLSSSVRWEKFNGGAWLELVSFLMDKYVVKVGNSLVIVKSRRAHSGQYRCSYPKPNSSSGDVNHVEYHVRVSGDSFSVKVTINQDKSPLGASADIVCTTSSDLPVTITWYKDNNVINPGGRFRLLSNNVLQISQIQREDQGIYQCFGRKERESAQSALRLQLADSPPRLLLGFLDQTLGGPGPDISLRCVFHSGYPLPKILWTIDGFLPVPDPRIILGDHVTSHGDMISYYNVSGTRVEDGGLYSCTASNTVATVRHSARLNIYGAPWVRVVPPVVAIGGEFLEIQCPVSGYPIAGISWEKDGLKLPLNQRQRVGSNGTLTITSVERSSDGGSYICSAWDSQGRIARREIQVNVVGICPPPPTLIEKEEYVKNDKEIANPFTAPLRIAPFPEKGRVVEEERVTLVCSLSSGLGTLKWSKGPAGKHFTHEKNSPEEKKATESAAPFNVLDTDGFTSLLSIASVKPSHAGVYTCTASDAISTVARSHELTVLVPVKIEPFAFQEGLKEGARSRLVCGVSQGDLPISFSFFKDHSPLELEHDKVGFNIPNISITSLDPWSRVLQFSFLTSDHTGEYSCLASNPASQVSYTSKLLVQVGPKWSREPLDANVSRGEEVEMHCSGSGVPPPVISWFKSTGDGLELKWRPVETLWPSGNVQTFHNGSLIFLEAEEHHGGQYMCKIENGIGPGESKIVQLDVNVPPYFTKTLERQSVSQGKSHEVTCEVHGDSPMSVAWMKDSNVFDSSPANRIYSLVHREGKKSRVTLVMKNLDPALDKGIYQCTANNSLGKVSQSFELWVEEKPGRPEDLRASEITSRELVLVWLPPHATPSTGSPEAFPPTQVITYLVEYSIAGDKSGFPIQRLDILGERTQVKIENLFPSSTYIFRVSGVNSAGNGPPAEIVARTLSSPPSAPPSNVRGRATANQGILISWSGVVGEMMHGVILGYRVLILSHLSNEEPRDLIVPVEGASFASSYALNESLISSQISTSKKNEMKGEASACCQFQVLALAPFTQYEIHISALNNAGEGPKSQPVLIRTLEDVPGSPVRVPSCVRLSYQSLQLSWQPPTLPNGIVNSYKVVYYPITPSSFRFAEIHQTSGLTTVLSGLMPNTNYSIHITPVNNAGESYEWTAVFCRTLEDVPSSPGDVVGYASSEKSVYLNWVPPRRPNGVLTHYTVYFRIVEGQTDAFESKRKISPSAVHFLENQLDLTRHKYVFWMTASNSKGESAPSAQIVLAPPPMVEGRVVGQSRVIEVYGGQALSLHCGVIGLPASSSVFMPMVRWTTNGGKPVPMSGNAFIKPGQNELIFVSVRKSDAGNYTCQPDPATQALVNGMVTYTLKVKGFSVTGVNVSWRYLVKGFQIVNILNKVAMNDLIAKHFQTFRL